MNMRYRSIACNLFIFMSFLFLGNLHCQIPQNEQIVNKLMGKTAKLLSKKYQSRPVGVSVGMPGGVVKSLGLEFDVVGPLTKAEIRQILFNFSDDLLSAINNDTNIRPYLECYPFTRDRIKIVLYLYDKNHFDLEPPHIGMASIKRGKLEYLTLITVEGVLNVKNEYVETEEEAIRTLKINI